MISDLDQSFQYLCVWIIYRHETLLLPLVALFIVASRHRPWLVPLRILTALVLVAYAMRFRMHWYSAVTVPILAGVIAADIARDYWFVLMRLRDTDTIAMRRQRVALSPERRAEVRTALRRQMTLYGVLLAGFIALEVILDEAPRDLVWMLLLVAVASAALLLVPWGSFAESSFWGQLRADPRCAGYFSWVRRVRARHAGGRAMLAPAADGVPSRLIWLAFLLRLLTRRRAMPTIQSNFVMLNLAYARGQLWREHEAARLNRKYDPDVEHWVFARKFSQWVTRAFGRAPADAPIPELSQFRSESAGLPDYLKADSSSAGVRRRDAWLLATEALAECHAFSNEAGSNDAGGGPRPDWLGAADLLAEAGDVQLEFVLDLRRHYDTEKERTSRETTRLWKLYDLSARCVEAELEPGGVDLSAGLAQRWRQFLGEGQGARLPQVGDSAADATGIVLRRILAARYQLLARIDPEHGVGLPPLEPNDGLMVGGFDFEQSARTLILACEHDTAQAALMIALSQGERGGRLALNDQQNWADQLAQADRMRRRARELEQRDRLDGLVPEVFRHINRVLHLWALGIEQDIHVLRQGSVAWRDRLETAAEFFAYAGSARARLLAEASAAEPAAADELLPVEL